MPLKEILADRPTVKQVGVAVNFVFVLFWVRISTGTPNILTAFFVMSCSPFTHVIALIGQGHFLAIHISS
jgi:hypothetical protein